MYGTVTPVQLAAEGVGVDLGARILKWRRGLDLRAGRAAMREAHENISFSVHTRLTDGLAAVAGEQVKIPVRSVKVADARFTPSEKSKGRPGFMTLSAGQEAMVNNADVVKQFATEDYHSVPLPCTPRDTEDPFDHDRFDHAMITEPALP